MFIFLKKVFPWKCYVYICFRLSFLSFKPSVCWVNCCWGYCFPSFKPLCIQERKSHLSPFQAITCFTFTQLHTITPGSWPLQLQSISGGHSHSTGITLRFTALVKDTWEPFSVSTLTFSHKNLGGICFGNGPVTKSLFHSLHLSHN